MYEEDLAPGREALAKERLAAVRQEKRRGATKIDKPTSLPSVFPTPGREPLANGNIADKGPLPGVEATPGQQLPTRDNENLTNIAEQRAAAGRLQQLARKRQAVYRQAQKVSTAQGAAKKYKQIRNIMRVAKIGTGLTLYGLFITWLIAHGEWIYHAFNKDYPFTVWDKRATIIADLIIILAIAAILTLIYFIIQSPGGELILKAIGV